MKPVIGIVGAGKVGATLGRLWNERGFHISAVYSRTNKAAQDLANRVGARVAESAGDVASRCDLTVLSVPDDVIGVVAGSISLSSLSAKGVIHTSGAHSFDVLVDLRTRGAMVGSIHPAYPFASVEASMAGLPGATFALEADDLLLKDWLIQLVEAVDGRLIEIPAGMKSLYHAALAISSNYTVVLYHIAERLLGNMDADRDAVANALNSLLDATIQNLIAKGPVQALTGPLVRGDVGTIQQHLQALARYPDISEVYVSLARAAEPLLRERGHDYEQISALKNILNS